MCQAVGGCRPPSQVERADGAAAEVGSEPKGSLRARDLGKGLELSFMSSLCLQPFRRVAGVGLGACSLQEDPSLFFSGSISCSKRRLWPAVGPGPLGYG